MTTMYYKQDLM